MKIFFASPHNYLDGSNGASITTREELLELSRRGWSVKTLCGDVFDAAPGGAEETLRATLKSQKIPYATERVVARVDGKEFAFLRTTFNDSGIESVVFQRRDRLDDRALVNRAFALLAERTIKSFSPDVFMSYGTQPCVAKIADAARREGVVAVFALHNLNYKMREHFRNFDEIIVPSEYARRAYERTLGLESRVLPPLIDERKVVAERNSRRFLTAVNPSPEKGLYFLVGIALELNRRRPDIPILVVEGRAGADHIAAIPQARKLTNLYYCQRVNSPTLFLRETRLTLVPSLWEEAFGRVTVESGFNGIPVLCSDRGASPEIANDPEATAPIPARFTQFSRELPTFEETAPWLDRIVRIWDDAQLARRLGENLRENTRKYSFARVADQLENMFVGFSRNSKKINSAKPGISTSVPVPSVAKTR